MKERVGSILVFFTTARVRHATIELDESGLIASINARLVATGVLWSTLQRGI
jgi:hypothetical protein